MRLWTWTTMLVILVSGALVSGGVPLLTTDLVSAHYVPSPCDFTTGGGWVLNDGTGNEIGDGTKQNFGLVGGCKHGGFFGHVNIVSHGGGVFFNGLHVSSTSIDGYFVSCCGATDEGYRDICGTANTNLYGQVKFRVRTKDVDEPGGLDRFGYKLTSTTTGGMLTFKTRELGPPGQSGGGGNIQLHKPNNSTTGPNPPPDEITACGSSGDDMGF